MNPNAFPLVLRNRNFSLLWLSQILNQGGTRMYQIALLWWLLQNSTEHSGLVTGVFLLLGAIPSLVFVKLIGKIVEKNSAKTLLIACDILSCFVVAGLLLFIDQPSIAIYMALLSQFLVFSMEAVIDPTLNKAIPELVEQNDIEKAVSFQTATQSIAYFGGALLGAIFIDILGIKGVIIFNCFTYLVSITANYFIQFKNLIRQEIKIEQKSDFQEIFADPSRRWIKKALFGFGAVNFFSTPTLVILPLYTMKLLHGTAASLGTLETAVWLGLLVGAFSTKIFYFIKNPLLIGTLCLFTLGFCLLIPGFGVNLSTYFTALFIGHLLLGINNVKFISLFQQVIPAEFKGRFFALLQAIIGFTFPVAFFLFGFLGDQILPSSLCLIQGIGIMFISMYFAKLALRWSKK